MTDLAGQLAREYPATNMNIGAKVVSLRDQLVGDLKSTLWAVTAGVGCVLLIACANLAGLLLTRGVGREREFAVRAALGAGRVRLIRQTLIESLLLAGFGGGAGVLIAQLTMPFLRYLVPGTLSAWSEPRIDLRLRGFPAAGLDVGRGPVWNLARIAFLAAWPFQFAATRRPGCGQRQHTNTEDAHRERSGAGGRAPGRGGVAEQNTLGPGACTARIPTRRSDDAKDVASRLGKFAVP